ncbi:MAG: kinase [Luteimonas sp.]
MTGRTHPLSPNGYADDFVARVLDDARAHDAGVYAIAGLQGTGKSTLSAQVAALAAKRGISMVVLSIDDFYFDRPQREALASTVHPLLVTRGPPGTHDVALACAVIDDLLRGKPTQLPRFDKIEDRQLPRADWPLAQLDPAMHNLIVLEGWFLKVPAQSETELVAPINALERDEDPDGGWRRYCNTALRRDYGPLWDTIDRMLFLHGPGFEVVSDWRWQQEQTLQAANPDRRAMTRPQVERFIQFFERVSRQALARLPAIADWCVAIDRQRHPLD